MRIGLLIWAARPCQRRRRHGRLTITLGFGATSAFQSHRPGPRLADEIVEVVRDHLLEDGLLQACRELNRSRNDHLALPVQGDHVIAIIEHHGFRGAAQILLQVVQIP